MGGAAVDRDRLLLNAITRAQMEDARSGDRAVVFDGLLAALLDLTDSEYGFIGEVLYRSDGAPYLKTHAITNIAWDDTTRAFYAKNAPSGMEFGNLKTLFGHVLTSGQPVIANAPGVDPRRGGLPEGHPPLNAFLGLPLRLDQDLMGMCGIANRPEGYDDTLVAFLEPFLLTCGTLIRSTRVREDQRRTERSLRESEARGRAILESTLEGIITIDERGRIEEVNPSVVRLFGYEAPELIGHNVSLLMPEPHRSRHDSYLSGYLETGRASVIGVGREVLGLRKDGSLFPLALSVSHLKLDGRSLFTGVVRDISEQKASEAKLKRLNDQMADRLAELARLNRDNLLLTQMGSFLQVSQDEAEACGVLSLYGGQIFPETSGTFFLLTESDILDSRAEWGRPTGARTLTTRQCWALRRGEPHAMGGGDRIVCAHITLRDQEQAICAPVMTRDGPIGLLTLQIDEAGASNHELLLRSVAERFGSALASLRLRRHLREESIRDPLTRLFNRRFMNEALTLEIHRCRRSGACVSVLLADLDHFKRLNDTHGHDAGDAALVELSRLLRQSVRAEDIVCRFGGEEFVLILANSDLEEAYARAELLREAVATKTVHLPDGGTTSITISFGVATFPTHGADRVAVIKQADEALYRAKERGRNLVERAIVPALQVP
jgi:diguanylate cyclase (GGDEF)-like protein/PAS domain S-box-containing protein